MTGLPFNGAKLFLRHGDFLLTHLRDDVAHIPFPGHWDLPGGGADPGETPIACALRELHEEYGLRMDPARLTGYAFQAVQQPGMWSWFFAGRITPDEIGAVRFGDEGQEWRMMPIAQYLAHPRGVPHFQDRIRLVMAGGVSPAAQ